MSLFRAYLYQLNHPIVSQVVWFGCHIFLLCLVVVLCGGWVGEILLLSSFIFPTEKTKYKICLCLFIGKYGLSGGERTNIWMCFLEKEKRERLNEGETDHCPFSHLTHTNIYWRWKKKKKIGPLPRDQDSRLIISSLKLSLWLNTYTTSQKTILHMYYIPKNLRTTTVNLHNMKRPYHSKQRCTCTTFLKLKNNYCKLA